MNNNQSWSVLINDVSLHHDLLKINVYLLYEPSKLKNYNKLKEYTL